MKAPATEQKLRGGYYTPPLITRFLADWAVQSTSDRVLEPSAGDGAFVSAALNDFFLMDANGGTSVELKAHGHPIVTRSNQLLGGELTGTPAASSWSADRIDVFAPGRDGRVWHRWWDGSRWVDWEQLD